MKRALRILAALVLFACLTGVGLAFSVFRPREVAFPATIENKRIGDTPWRTRIEVKHRWRLSPSMQYGRIGFNRLGVHFQTIDRGWWCGPFVFEEERQSRSWPLAVEKAARKVAVQKLGVKEPSLEFHLNEVGESWHIVASGPGRKRVEMDMDAGGKPALLPTPR